MMHGRGESDSAIVAAKPTNKAERSAAEPVEPRAEAAGNASQQSTVRTQSPGNRVTGAGAHMARRDNIAKRRHTPEEGAVCPNWASTDLCGGARGNSRPYREHRADLSP